MDLVTAIQKLTNKLASPVASPAKISIKMVAYYSNSHVTASVFAAISSVKSRPSD